MGKERELKHSYTSSSSSMTGTQFYSRDYCSEIQSIQSSGHRGWRNLSASSGDVGGFFSSTKLKWGPMPTRVHLQGDVTPSVHGWQSKGILVPAHVEYWMRYGIQGTPSNVAATMPQHPSQSAQMALGATAIARCSPRSPVWDGATAVAELVSGGLPTIPGKQMHVGSEYLNYAFGIAPTVSDIGTMGYAAQKSEQIIAQLERDSGRPIRRKYEFPRENLGSSVGTTTDNYPVMLGGAVPTAYEVGRGRMTETSTKTRQSKFSGAFMYHLPPKGSWRRHLAEMDAVYGVQPGLDTAWNALPFSWLADWYGNMGDVLKNMSEFAQDGLVLKYGYISTLTEETIRFSYSYPIRLYGAMNNYTTYAGVIECTKSVLTRYPANPYGFGVSNASLNGRQLAILAALGHTLV